MDVDTDRSPEDGGAGSGEGVAAKFAEIESRLCQSYEDMLVSAKEIGEVTSHHVRLHPLLACGVAFFAGITLARILKR
jgi:hypothetical protein